MIFCQKTALLTCLIVAGVLLGGCVSKPKPLYYYGDYQKTLYKLKKDPSPARLAAHQESLEDIIKESKDQNLRVPPGVYCEYGYLLWQKGQRADAEAQFNLEVQTYPESQTFVSLVVKMLKHEPAK